MCVPFVIQISRKRRVLFYIYFRLSYGLFCAYKLLCYHRRNLFVCLWHIARPSGRNWVGLYEGGVRYGGYCCFQYMYWNVIFFHSLPSRVGFKVSGFPFLNCFASFFVRCYLSSRTALGSCVPFVIALRSLWENFFADTRFVLLTQAINLFWVS